MWLLEHQQKQVTTTRYIDAATTTALPAKHFSSLKDSSIEAKPSAKKDVLFCRQTLHNVNVAVFVIHLILLS